MEINKEWLKKKILEDPDIEFEVGVDWASGESVTAFRNALGEVVIVTPEELDKIKEDQNGK